MTLYYEDEFGADFPFDGRELAGRVIAAALEHEGFDYEAEVSLTIVGDEEIRQINREHRQIDKSTDVLSFPMLEYETPGDFGGIDEEADADPDTGEIVLGDIIISYEHVISQAEEYGHSTEREFAFLIVHSMLHLMGYDHMEEDERAVMEEHQKDILTNLNITRGE